jgi:hypothetical protein
MTDASKSRLRYLIGGLMIGCFWYLNRHRPPWEEALRTMVTFALLMTLLKAHLRRKSVEVRLVPLISAKVALVIVAALIQSVLARTMDDPGLVVAIGLGLTVALIAPLAGEYFFTKQPAVPSSTWETTS